MKQMSLRESGYERMTERTCKRDPEMHQTKLERTKASIRVQVEHPFRVTKRQFGHVKVRYRGLAKATAQSHTLFALSNLRMVRRTLLQDMRA